MGHKTKGQLKNLVDFYVRNLRNAGLATDDELSAVAKPFKGGRTKDDLWGWLTELKGLARVRRSNRQPRGAPVKANALETAIAALEGRAESVYLASIKKTVKVVPASWTRIMLVEDLSWWVTRLSVVSLILRDKEDRPEWDEGFDQLLNDVIEETRYQRSRLYAQVTAPDARPVEDGEVDWADDITPAEDFALLQAWHRVNLDLLANLPQPVSKDGKRDLPRHWAFVFQSVAWRERRAPEEIIRNRSLVSIVASTVLEALKADAADGKRGIGMGYTDEDDVAEALGIDA